MTPQRYLLLLMIKGAPDGSERSTVSELTRLLKLEQHTVTELVGRAERAGFIARERSATDGRIVFLRLTDEGQACVAAIFREHDQERQALLSALQDAEERAGASSE